MKAVLFVVASFLLGGSAFAQQDFWANRQAAYRAADILQQEVETLDEALHGVNAPHDLIELVHHYEETVGEFVEIVRVGSYAEAQGEMNHIRQDVGLIRDKFAQYSWVLNYPQVNTEWRHVRTAYRNLDHVMFLHVPDRYSPEYVKQLERDMQELLDSHAE